MISKIFKIILFLVLSYQTPVYSKSTSFNDFNSRDLSNYFSGIIAYENRDNSEALKYFNLSKVLLNSHDNYLKRGSWFFDRYNNIFEMPQLLMISFQNFSY